MREETVSINGVLYNARTGQAIKKVVPKKNISKPPPKKVFVRQPKKIIVKNAPKQVKRKPTSSQTLNRQFVKKPRIAVKKVTNKPTVQKTKPQPRPSVQQIPTRIMGRGIKRPKPAPKTSPKQAAPAQSKTSDKKKNRLIAAIASIAVVVIVAGVVLAYFFVPSFSVWVASSRSGVNAVLPVFTPAEYKVSGVAESAPGIVTLNYQSSTLSDSYTINQANSNWDSAGVLENKVKPLGGSYQTLSQKGLTIYRYSTGAIWVNGGILYTITDEGKLSNEQILHIVDGI